MERNLTLLRRLRSKLDGGFERLPFGVQRQVILAFVEGVSVREHREMAIHLRLTLDNGGIQHLCDEMDAVDSGRWTDANEGFSDGESAGDKADALYVPSGPTWRPLVDEARTRLELNRYEVLASVARLRQMMWTPEAEAEAG